MMRRTRCGLLIIPLLLLLPLLQARLEASAKKAGYNQKDNAIWLRRHWMHEAPSPTEIAALVDGLRNHGIRRIYPFLGPMDHEGWPGWRSKAGFIRYSPNRSEAFLAEFHKIAPEIPIIPWTGGVKDADVHLEDETQRKAFAEQARRLISLGADGVQLNIEPMPAGAPGYMELLRETKSAIGEHTLSIAAYPPPTIPRSDGEDYWDLKFLTEVCKNSNELVIMAYNTGATSPAVFEKIVSTWMQELAGALPPPSKGGCEWLMGVPAYDDDTEYHRPNVETVEHSLAGILSGLQHIKHAENFRGVSIYASFTMDEHKWAVYDNVWRGVKVVGTSPLDPRNTME